MSRNGLKTALIAGLLFLKLALMQGVLSISSADCQHYLSDVSGRYNNLLVFLPTLPSTPENNVHVEHHVTKILLDSIKSGVYRASTQVVLIGKEITLGEEIEHPIYKKKVLETDYKAPYRVYYAGDICESIDENTYTSDIVTSSLKGWQLKIPEVNDTYSVYKRVMNWLSLVALINPPRYEKKVDLLSSKLKNYYEKDLAKNYKSMFSKYVLLIIERPEIYSNARNLNYIKLDTNNDYLKKGIGYKIDNKNLSPHLPFLCPSAVYTKEAETLLGKTASESNTYVTPLYSLADYDKILDVDHNLRKSIYSTPVEKIIIDSYDDPKLLENTYQKITSEGACSSVTGANSILSSLIVGSGADKVVFYTIYTYEKLVNVEYDINNVAMIPNEVAKSIIGCPVIDKEAKTGVNNGVNFITDITCYKDYIINKNRQPVLRQPKESCHSLKESLHIGYHLYDSNCVNVPIMLISEEIKESPYVETNLNNSAKQLADHLSAECDPIASNYVTIGSRRVGTMTPNVDYVRHYHEKYIGYHDCLEL